MPQSFLSHKLCDGKSRSTGYWELGYASLSKTDHALKTSSTEMLQPAGKQGCSETLSKCLNQHMLCDGMAKLGCRQLALEQCR